MKKAIEKIVEKASAEIVAAVHAHLLGQLSPSADTPAKSAKADTGKKRGRPKLTEEQKAAKVAAATPPAEGGPQG